MKTSQGLKNSWRWGLSGSSGLSGRKSWDWNLCFFSATKRVVILLVFSCLKFKLLLFSERNRSFGSCPSEGISAWKFGLPTSEPSPVFEQLADHFFARRKGLVIRINAEGLTVAKGVSSLPYPTDNLESSQHGSSQLPSLTTKSVLRKSQRAKHCHSLPHFFGAFSHAENRKFFHGPWWYPSNPTTCEDSNVWIHPCWEFFEAT